MKTLIFLITLLFSSIVFAQVPLEKGDPAPDDGVFLTNEETAKIIAEKNAAEKLCIIDKDYLVKTEKQQCILDKKLLQNEVEYQKEKYKKIMEIRDDSEKELYRQLGNSGNNMYWFAGGAAAGAVAVVVSVVSVYLIVQSGK